jgi:transposase-like protein
MLLTGAVVSKVARRQGLKAQQFLIWWREARRLLAASTEAEAPNWRIPVTSEGSAT